MANILVVDDELGMRQFLTHLLQREGHVVRVAENGHEALDLLRAQPPDLIISDIRMPDMSGVDLLRTAREMLPEVEVIAPGTLDARAIGECLELREALEKCKAQEGEAGIREKPARHRHVDGESGSRFLADVASMMEDPAAALLF